MVDSQVCFLEYRSQFKLVGGNLIVACLARNAQFQRLNLQFAHKSCDTLRDAAKVMVVHLLVLC